MQGSCKLFSKQIILSSGVETLELEIISKTDTILKLKAEGNPGIREITFTFEKRG